MSLDIVLKVDTKFKDGTLHMPETGAPGLYIGKACLHHYFIALDELKEACYNAKENEWKWVNHRAAIMINPSGELLIKMDIPKLEVRFSKEEYKKIKSVFELV